MKENHNDREHATLSPSTAERWFNCPGSIRLSRGKRSMSGPAAIEGTRAHEFASNILLENSDLEAIPETDMRAAVQRYVEFVDHLEDKYPEEFEYLVEEKIDLRHLGGDCWGTLDYASWVVGDDLYVCDYKHGLVTVEVQNNKQLKTYASGILEKIGYDFKYIYLVIIQPRAAHVNGPIRSQRVTPQHMKIFKQQLKKAIKETKDDNAQLSAGSWCQYCPAIGHCPEIVGAAQDLAKIEFADSVSGENTRLPAIESITDDQLSLIIEHTRTFRAWLDACGDEAVERIQKGTNLSGLKLVRCPGRARWRDPDKLPKRFTRRVPYTITEARKLGEVEKYVERPPGKIIATSKEDGRALYISAKVEFE